MIWKCKYIKQIKELNIEYNMRLAYSKISDYENKFKTDFKKYLLNDFDIDKLLYGERIIGVLQRYGVLGTSYLELCKDGKYVPTVYIAPFSKMYQDYDVILDHEIRHAIEMSLDDNFRLKSGLSYSTNHIDKLCNYIPETDELYCCEKGKGARCNGKKLEVSNTTKISKSLTTIGFNNRYPEERISFNRVHDKCMSQMLNVEKLFSAVISLCYVASGKIESHFELNCFLWDICVGSLLVEEAGGKCSTLNNENVDYSKVDKQIIIATNGKIHNDFEKIIHGSF